MVEKVYFDLDEVKEYCLVTSGTTIYNWEREKNFPRRIKIGRKSIWVIQEVEEWIRSRPRGNEAA